MLGGGLPPPVSHTAAPGGTAQTPQAASIHLRGSIHWWRLDAPSKENGTMPVSLRRTLQPTTHCCQTVVGP
eukprot:4152570-Prymnesium_polylepis.1